MVGLRLNKNQYQVLGTQFSFLTKMAETQSLQPSSLLPRIYISRKLESRIRDENQTQILGHRNPNLTTKLNVCSVNTLKVLGKKSLMNSSTIKNFKHIGQLNAIHDPNWVIPPGVGEGDKLLQHGRNLNITCLR